MFAEFLQNSLVAAGLIAVILLLRRIPRLPSACIDALWLAALLRLCIPFDLPSPLSIYQLFGRVPQASRTPPFALSAAPAADPSLSVLSILCVLWACGLILGLSRLLFSYRRLSAVCRDAAPVCHPLVTQAIQKSGLRRTVSVRQTPAVTVPCTFGILRPVILLPDTLNLDQPSVIPYMLAHELTHIRRLDCLRKLLFQVVRCVHWFNPMVWLLCRAAGRDLERACDTAVLRTLSGDRRAAYAASLLHLAQTPQTSALSSAFGKTDLEERIYAIMTFKKRSMVSILMTAAVVAATTSAFATNVPDTQAASCTPAVYTASESKDAKVSSNTATEATGITEPAVTITYTGDDEAVLSSTDIVSQETQPDGSLLLTLKDGSQVTVVSSALANEAQA